MRKPSQTLGTKTDASPADAYLPPARGGRRITAPMGGAGRAYRRRRRTASGAENPLSTEPELLHRLPLPAAASAAPRLAGRVTPVRKPS